MARDPGNRWTPEEDALFRSMAEANTGPETIAANLGRSVHAVKARAYTIGLPLKWFNLRAKGKWMPLASPARAVIPVKR
jgi:hypothetical protein